MCDVVGVVVGDVVASGGSGVGHVFLVLINVVAGWYHSIAMLKKSVVGFKRRTEPTTKPTDGPDRFASREI